MTEDDTFLKLKRIPLSELERIYDTDPVLRRYWHSISDRAFADYLEHHGWKFKDYLKWYKDYPAFLSTISKTSNI